MDDPTYNTLRLMDSECNSPRKRITKKTGKSSPTRPKLLKAKSMLTPSGNTCTFQYHRSESIRSVQGLQDQLDKLPKTDQLQKLQNITTNQLRKICNFVSDRDSLCKLQCLIEEQKVEISTQQLLNQQTNYQREQEDLAFLLDLEVYISKPLSGTRAEIPSSHNQAWWEREEDIGERLDFF